MVIVECGPYLPGCLYFALGYLSELRYTVQKFIRNTMIHLLSKPAEYRFDLCWSPWQHKTDLQRFVFNKRTSFTRSSLRLLFKKGAFPTKQKKIYLLHKNNRQLGFKIDHCEQTCDAESQTPTWVPCKIKNKSNQKPLPCFKKKWTGGTQLALATSFIPSRPKDPYTHDVSYIQCRRIHKKARQTPIPNLDPYKVPFVHWQIYSAKQAQ